MTPFSYVWEELQVLTKGSTFPLKEVWLISEMMKVCSCVMLQNGEVKIYYMVCGESWIDL